MGQRLQVDWEESADELEALYKQEQHMERRMRLQALWHLRRGKRIADVEELLGVRYRTLQKWVAWYRQGGLAEVLRHVTGHGSKGAKAYLGSLQQRAVLAKVELGEFRTVWEGRAWVKDRWGVMYTYKGMHDLLERHDCRPKVPRPQSEKADKQRQEAWKKGG